MNGAGFCLKPFTGESPGCGRPSSALEITGKIARSDKWLSLDFLVAGRWDRQPGSFVVEEPLKLSAAASGAGALAQIDFPAHAKVPLRKESLWEQTCFELFVSPKGSSQYWEFNISPSGHWNVYRFSAYREGMREETAFESLPFSTSRAHGFFSVSLQIEPARIIEADRQLAVAVSAVIRGKDGGTSFWGLTHCGSKPDFHNRASFIIEL